LNAGSERPAAPKEFGGGETKGNKIAGAGSGGAGQKTIADFIS